MIATLFQATVIALIFALINGTEFNSYWIFYGSLVFGAIYIASLRYLYEARPAGCSTGSAISAARSWSAPATASSRSRTRFRTPTTC